MSLGSDLAWGNAEYLTRGASLRSFWTCVLNSSQLISANKESPTGYGEFIVLGGRFIAG